jgi:hypothetical protein
MMDDGNETPFMGRRKRITVQKKSFIVISYIPMNDVNHYNFIS